MNWIDWYLLNGWYLLNLVWTPLVVVPNPGLAAFNLANPPTNASSRVVPVATTVISP